MAWVKKSSGGRQVPYNLRQGLSGERQSRIGEAAPTALLPALIGTPSATDAQWRAGDAGRIMLAYRQDRCGSTAIEPDEYFRRFVREAAVPYQRARRDRLLSQWPGGPRLSRPPEREAGVRSGVQRLALIALVGVIVLAVVLPELHRGVDGYDDPARLVHRLRPGRVCRRLRRHHLSSLVAADRGTGARSARD